MFNFYTTRNIKIGANVSLIAILLLLLKQLIVIYQNLHQLASPLVPESTVLLIIKPIVFIGIGLAFTSIVATIRFFYEKYLLVIILAFLTIIWQQYFAYLSL